MNFCSSFWINTEAEVVWFDGMDGSLHLQNKKIPYACPFKRFVTQAKPKPHRVWLTLCRFSGDVVGVGRDYSSSNAIFFTLNGTWLGHTEGPVSHTRTTHP